MMMRRGGNAAYPVCGAIVTVSDMPMNTSIGQLITLMTRLADRYLVSDWRDWWKWFSTYAAAGLTAWNTMPEALSIRIPEGLNLGVSAALLMVYLASRLTDQPVLDGDTQE